MAAGNDQAAPATAGFLGKQLFVIVTTPVKPREEMMKLLPAHLEHQVALERRGTLFAAGPLDDKEGKVRGKGLIVIRAGSFEEAAAIAAEDPFHKAGVRTFTVERWTVNEGRVTIGLSYSDQRFTLD